MSQIQARHAGSAKLARSRNHRRDRQRFRPSLLEPLEIRLVMTATSLVAADVSALYHGTATLSASLLSAGLPVAGETIDFYSLDGNEVGTAVTGKGGVATLSNVSVAFFDVLGPGTYNNSLSALFAGSGNYSSSASSSALTLTPAPLTIVADDATKVYGQANPTFTGTVDGVFSGDTVTANFTSVADATSGVQAGGYAITFSGLTGAQAGDYSTTVTDGSSTPGTLTVAPDPLNLPAYNLTTVYGQSPVDTGIALTPADGILNGDMVDCNITTPGQFSHVGSYPADFGNLTGAEASDYTVVSAAVGTQTVTPDPLNLPAYNLTTVYGDVPTLTGIAVTPVEGTVNGDVVDVNYTSAAQYSDVGDYAIVFDSLTGPNAFDYTVGSPQFGTQVVTPATLTITPDDHSKVYGAALTLGDSDFTDSGLVNDDSVSSVTLTSDGAAATAGVAGSPYSITPSAANGSGLANYNITYDTGNLTVTPAPLVVSVEFASKVYGQPVPTLIGFYSGFVNGDTPNNLTTTASLATTATLASHVGTYPITASGASGANYAITYQAGTLDVTPATLTVTPNDVTKPLGVAVPTLTATYSGFVNGDTTASLTTPVTLSTTATAGSDFGDYPITATGGTSTDYSIVVSGQGTLTVPTNSIQTDFLGSVYQAILGRTPDSFGLDAWQAAMNNGLSQANVIGQIYNSSEAVAVRADTGTVANPEIPVQIALIEALYEDLLGRSPEGSGLDGWLARMDQGENAAQVASEIQNSPEAVADRTNPPTPSADVKAALVDALYLNILGRDPETSGLNGWVTMLDNGNDAAQVAADIENSPEAVAHRNVG